MNQEMPEVLTLREFAEGLRIAPITIKRWCKSGYINFFKVNKRGDHRFLRSELMRIRNNVK